MNGGQLCTRSDAITARQDQDKHVHDELLSRRYDHDMDTHRALRYAAVATALALLCVAALIRFEVSLDSHFTAAQQQQLRSRAQANELVFQGGQATAASSSRGSTPSSQLSSLQDDEYDVDELMTPELIAQIKSRENDCLAPVHVHLLWIGDLEKAPKDRLKYIEMGYNLTVHTSADEILDGFQPYVKRAYRKALPSVVGHDFLKFAMLYKYGGFSVDADTSPVVEAATISMPKGCELLLGKEVHLHRRDPPVYRESGENTYGYSRPFQVLNWAMVASKPRNKHIKWLLQAAMMHFFGLRDMEKTYIQDVSGSGLITDYVAFLHEREGRNFPKVYDTARYIPVEGICLADDYLKGKWIHHSSLGSWKKPGAN